MDDCTVKVNQNFFTIHSGPFGAKGIQLRIA